MAVVMDQCIARRAIHLLAHALKHAARYAEIARDIAHPLVVNLVGPVRTNYPACGQPHQEVALRRWIQHTGIEHNDRLHTQ